MPTCQDIDQRTPPIRQKNLRARPSSPILRQMKLHLFELDEVPYAQALDAQHTLHEMVRQRQIDGAMLMLTHPSTYTLGRHASTENIRDYEAIKQLGDAIHHVDRGGDITWHGPGQLVIYPILSLDLLRFTVRDLICLLSNTLRATLAAFGITAVWDDDNPGVWVGREKIAAIGLRISRRISRHGVALNIAPELGAYDLIIPCGLKNRGVTSMERVLGDAPKTFEVRERFVQTFLELLVAAGPDHQTVEVTRHQQLILSALA